MPILIGLLFALAVAVFARVVGLDRDRAFYPTVLIVIAFLYGLFAMVGGSVPALLQESFGIVAFTSVAVLGFKFSPWLVAAGLAAHGVYDFFHPHVISNPGVPAWWPMFCLSYDVAAAAFLAVLLLRQRAAPRS